MHAYIVDMCVKHDLLYLEMRIKLDSLSTQTHLSLHSIYQYLLIILSVSINFIVISHTDSTAICEVAKKIEKSVKPHIYSLLEANFVGLVVEWIAKRQLIYCLFRAHFRCCCWSLRSANEATRSNNVRKTLFVITISIPSHTHT